MLEVLCADQEVRSSRAVWVLSEWCWRSCVLTRKSGLHVHCLGIERVVLEAVCAFAWSAPLVAFAKSVRAGQLCSGCWTLGRCRPVPFSCPCLSVLHFLSLSVSPSFPVLVCQSFISCPCLSVLHFRSLPMRLFR